MTLADKWTETIYQIATSKKKLKIILTPLGLTFWLGLAALLVWASLWLDSHLKVLLPLPAPNNVLLSLPLLVVGASLVVGAIYSFIRAKGSPVPFNPPQMLITSGLYRRIRNPMVLGWFVILFGLGILFTSISLIFVFTPLFVLLNIIYLMAIEEREMERKFGEQYLEYKRNVPMFIPRLSKRIWIPPIGGK